MDMTGEQRINAPKQVVWDALNDVEALKASIPGCEEVERKSDTEFAAKVRLAVGPVKARFSGDVTLSDIDAPNGYTLTGQGSGGAAGFGKGEAKVTLTEEGDETVISYTAHATVGGKLAQIGQRLIDSTAKKLARQFFDNLAQYLNAQGEGETTEEVPSGAQAPAAESAPAAAPAAQPAPTAAAGGGQGLFWGMTVVALIILWFINH
ncbi:MAG TPA: carbon monoxide dehydrogenase subunit G [Alphaproteobacteria bacterium]|nr:carbon monoxide dehydrogenase subunit G [Alphaproteobacteria bacterium]